MKRLNDEEKSQLGYLIHYYRNQYFHSDMKNAEDFKQTNFCKDICSQAQLSRLEHGDPLKDQEIYEKLLKKLNLELEKISIRDISIFETYFENILIYQNDDNLIINYNEYVLLINKYQNIFKKNIIYTHYNYALEFILAILNDDIEEASYIIEEVENNIDILPLKFLIVTLHYIGIYYHLINDYNKAIKFYLFSIEHMHKSNINNSIIYIDLAYNYIKINEGIYALDYLNKALNIFDNTHNTEILERIYRCYGLICLKNKYYGDGINHLINSLEYAKKTNKKNIIIYNYYLISAGFYLSGLYEKALETINNAEIIKSTERGELIKIIINQKINNNQIDITFKDENCELVRGLYYCDNKEEYFENNIEKNLNSFSEVVNLIILNDILSIYKENKKYKKALDLLETYII